ncbi:MAG: hypothetical protein QM784_20080 [Polyangiaceae bacterium]
MDEPTHQTRLTEGDHLVEATFEGFKRHATDAVAVDLTFKSSAGINCVRLPLTGHAIRYTPRARPVVMGGFDFFGGSPVAGHFGSGSLRVGYGDWLGPLRVTAETGLGFVSCEESRCGREGKDETLRSGFAFPIALSMQYVKVYDEGAPIFGQGFGVGVRYVNMYARLPALSGDQSRVIHSLYFVPAWAMGDGLPLGFSSDGRPTTMELELPVGLRMASDGGSVDTGYSIGFGLRFVGPL